VKWSRAVTAAVLFGALGVAAATATCRLSSYPVAAPCNASALVAPYHGVRSVASFGCVGAWAYLWVTVGYGAAEVSVTELLRYDGASGEWRNALRAVYCNRHDLPSYVETWGCNSN